VKVKDFLDLSLIKSDLINARYRKTMLLIESPSARGLPTATDASIAPPLRNASEWTPVDEKLRAGV